MINITLWYIAFREDYAYCKQWNTQFLLAKSYTPQEQIDHAIDDITQVPFDMEHQALAHHAVRAIYESREITEEDFNQVYAWDGCKKMSLTRLNMPEHF